MIERWPIRTASSAQRSRYAAVVTAGDATACTPASSSTRQIVHPIAANRFVMVATWRSTTSPVMPRTRSAAVDVVPPPRDLGQEAVPAGVVAGDGEPRADRDLQSCAAPTNAARDPHRRSARRTLGAHVARRRTVIRSAPESTRNVARRARRALRERGDRIGHAPRRPDRERDRRARGGSGATAAASLIAAGSSARAARRAAVPVKARRGSGPGIVASPRDARPRARTSTPRGAHPVDGSPSLRWSHDTTRSTFTFTTTRLFNITSTNGFISSEYGPW